MSHLQTRGTVTGTAAPSFKRWRIQIFAVTWIAYAGYYFTRQSFSVAKVGILDDPTVNASLTQQMLGVLDAAYLLAYAVGQFVWGSLADRFGPRVIVLGGLAMSAVAAVFMGFTTAIVLFLPLMVVQGLAQSTGWSSLCKNMACFFTIKERGRVLGLWSSNYAFGGLAAAPFVGWVAYSLFDNWRASFFAGAAVVAVVLVVIAIGQRNKPEDVGLDRVDVLDQAAEERRALAVEREARLGWRDQVKLALSDRMIVTLGATYFLLKPARYAILLWGPVIVTQRIPGVTNLEAVIIPIAFGVAGLAAPILIGTVSDKLFKARRVPPCVFSLLGLVVALALFMPMTASGSVPLMVLMLAVIGVTVYAADAMISCVSAVDFGTSERAGTAAGFVNGCGSIGAVLGGLLPGFIGGTALFYGFAGSALLAALILAPHWKRMPTHA